MNAIIACDKDPYQHRLEGKKYVTPEGTLSGSNITLLDAVSNCVRYFYVSLNEVLMTASALPASVLGMEFVMAELKAGKAATLLLLSDTLSLEKIFINGVEHLRSNN